MNELRLIEVNGNVIDLDAITAVCLIYGIYFNISLPGSCVPVTNSNPETLVKMREWVIKEWRNGSEVKEFNPTI